MNIVQLPDAAFRTVGYNTRMSVSCKKGSRPTCMYGFMLVKVIAVQCTELKK